MFSPVTRSTALAVSTLLAGTVLTACSGGDTQDSGRLQVVAAFYPLQYAAERVAGEHADVTNLTQPGKEPHDLELSVRQVAAISKADVVVFEEHFQTAVDAAVEDSDAAKVDAAAVVDLLPPATHEEGAEGHEGHEGHAEEGHEDEGHEDEGHEDEAHAEEEAHDEHDHGDLDPHFWQDPVRMAELGDSIADELSEVDPDNASAYAANAAALRTDLEKLDDEFSNGLEGCKRDLVVVNHDAFGYLAKYGLHLEPIAGLSPDAEPTAATLAELHELIKDEGITTVFSETLVSPKTAEALAGDLDIDAAVLDPLEGLTAEAEENGGDYLSVMRQNLDSLKKANAC